MTRSLVTGAGGRIGREIALYLAARGHQVTVHYSTSQAGADETVALITKAGGQAVAIQADLLDEDATQTLLPRAAEALGGPISCLINNASTFEDDDLHSATQNSWDRNIGSNLRAPFVLTQAMAAQGLEPEIDPADEPRATGLIINMIDQRVRKLTPHYMSYTIAKAGLWTMTQTTARALAPAIRVNGIGPGPTLIASEQTDAGYARQRRTTVLGRGSNPSDITAAVGYFLDAPAVTGQLLCTDGGQHLGWETPDVIGTN